MPVKMGIKIEILGHIQLTFKAFRGGNGCAIWLSDRVYLLLTPEFSLSLGSSGGLHRKLKISEIFFIIFLNILF